VRLAQRECGDQLDGEVAIAHGIEAVAGHAIEAQLRRHGGAINREGGSGQRAGAQRRLARSCGRVGQPAAIAREHRLVGE